MHTQVQSLAVLALEIIYMKRKRRGENYCFEKKGREKERANKMYCVHYVSVHRTSTQGLATHTVRQESVSSPKH